MIHIDTNRILDKCHCGAWAGYEHKDPRGPDYSVRVGCSECCEQTPYDKEWGLASVAWNLMQRKLKGLITDTPIKTVAFVIPKRRKKPNMRTH